MDTGDYTDNLEKDLKDSSTYTEVGTDNTIKVLNSLKKHVQQMYKRGSISNEMKSYLVPSDVRQGKVQGNPKIHKDGNPLRTIVNGRGHPTERVAELVEFELQEHVEGLPSYIKDTTHFLQKLKEVEQPLPAQTILFCFDVKALYPSVPRMEAKEACKEALGARTDQTIPTDDVLQLMDIVLENNTFSFNGKNYLQKEGTAIGSRLGKNYACTYMGAWETELLRRSKLKPSSYFRFVDDVWGIWIHGREALGTFHCCANSIHPRIKVEMRTSDESIEFLDVTTRIEDGFLKTDLYSKPTDKHLYLHRQSDHPNTTKNAIPFGLGIRAKRICSAEKDYRMRRNEISDHLQRRGYRKERVEHQLERVDGLNRDDLLEYRRRENSNDRVPLVLTYTDALPDVHSIIRKHITTLHKSENLRTVFPDPPLVSYRRGRNLQDILVHRKHNNILYRQTNGCAPCGKNCALCKNMKTCDSFEAYDGTSYKIQGSITCKTANVVYGIECRQCRKFLYVGQTGGTLYQRMLLNFSMIRTGKQDAIALHFNGQGHSVDDMVVLGIEKINKDCFYRRTKESLWIKKMRTRIPYGLNTMTS
ncbi:MAG: GIY-YIG nuclease family protein [Candidatus Thiodiazotropha endolucinida]|nr:GIY-YIG nuclease family protein [Candidatus Thiodiazotropha taylori]MCW4264772.1 GIY-YIG nuclease family protein [Candidatus Thiodiazotropha endolucinida]